MTLTPNPDETTGIAAEAPRAVPGVTPIADGAGYDGL
jgi:hypothetical protein